MSYLRRILGTFSRRASTWSQPEGHDTGIQIYNCIAREKVPLIIKNKNCMTWYTCGPTVYDSAHVGHASCYVKIDIIQRILRDHFKLNLITAMNITDIDDKIINESKLRNQSPLQIAKFYEKEYLEDLELLRVVRPNVVLRVTDNMSVILKFIKKLVDENHAYRTEDGSVYFDLKAYPHYGKLVAVNDPETAEKENSELKKNPNDFALWKAAKLNEPYWDSPFGSGRPGWHIECSALAGNLIGSTLDIHAGGKCLRISSSFSIFTRPFQGVDLKFPHHENEEAQSCAYFTKTQWVNYWLHTGQLRTKDAVKMSKSLKNTASIRSMLQATTSDVFRVACLLSHYRSDMEYSSDLINNAATVLHGIKHFVDDCTVYLRGTTVQSNVNNEVLLDHLGKTAADVHGALGDDFNTPAAMKSIQSLITVTNSMLHNNAAPSSAATTTTVINHSVYIVAVLNFVVNTLDMFGVDLIHGRQADEGADDYSDIINVLIKFRQNVRGVGIVNKDESLLQYCDEVREELKRSGVYVKDHGRMSSWSR